MIKRIEEAEIAGKGITPLSDTPALSSGEMRAKFDELALEVIVPAVNNNADALTAESAADEIGASVPEGVTPEPVPNEGEGAKLAAVLRGIVSFAKDFVKSWSYSKNETEQRINTKVVEIGTGDMAKAIYDPQNTGRVLKSLNADRLDGSPAAFYMGMVFQNLFDNSSLTINQRAQSAYTTADYCVDRWRISGTAALAVPTRTLTAAVYSVKSSAIFQPINNTEKELAIGDSLSFSAKINGTIYTGTSVILDRGLYTSFLDVPYAFENDAFGVICCTAVGNTAITNFNIVPKKALAIEWVKLEKGTIATPYVPKGYGAELAECQRYYQKYTVRFTEILGYVALGHILLHSIPLSPPMRIAPSVFCTVLDIQGVDIASVEGASRGNTGIIVGMQPTAAFLHILMNVRITADL